MRTDRADTRGHDIAVTQPAGPAAGPARPGGRHFAAVGYAFAVVYLSNNAPTPLYPRYQHAWHLGSGTITGIFAIYVVGVLAALFFLGRLSDLRGRRTVLLSAVALMAVAVALLLGATSLGWLLAARVVQGLAIGAFTGTATAALAELEPRGDARRAGLVTTLATAIGIAVGTVTTGVLAQYLPWPTRLPYAVALVLLLVALAGLWRVPETVPEQARSRTSLRQALTPSRIAIGPGLRLPFTLAALAGFCAFAVVGLFSALVPTLLAALLHQRSSAASGLTVAAVFAASALAQLTSARLGTRATAVTGLTAIAAGLVLLTLAMTFGSTALLVLGGVVVGAGNGLGLSGGLRLLNGLASPERRGQFSAAFWLVAYVGTALPTFGMGVGADAAGLLAATVGFTVLIGGISLVGAFSLAVHRRGA